MKTAEEYLAAAYSNSMSPTWCAARVAAIRAHLNEAGTTVSPERYRTWLIELLSQFDSEVLRGQRAVQAVIDHYDPLPGVVEPVYRVVAPPQTNVFPPACPRCLQRGADCLCPPMFPPREEPPF